MKLSLSPEITVQIGQLYYDMEKAYDIVADQLKLSCTGCPDNCCDSYFLHHTYLEWGYLWFGLEKLSFKKQQEIFNRAEKYDRQSEELVKQGERPRLMCPLNENGRCVLYQFRLMICRTHGVPAAMIRPDGRKLSFPGCFVCQEIVEKDYMDISDVPVMERTELLKRMVALEQALLQGKRHLVPRLKMTIAKMLVSGPPVLPE